ncbi:MAG: 3'-5' exonuclease DinG [Chlamydiales bacterium]|nr:3'-5' exonuclease DinG [Chlamydiales bacterium]MCH9620474.1 3'-5' exonuclease DinG [Chlamydiales bacterium]MCH9623460.1 3'-5' exonuclease DinG [Chlamydiales bacterium]
MTKKRPIYYDTETTGVRSAEDRIIEIAAFDSDRKKEFSMLVNPGIPIPPDATAIHGITDEMVKEAPSFKEVGEAFITFCGEEGVLIAHNNDNFDRHFLTNEAARHGFTFPEWEMVDSLKWARKYRPDLPKHSLQFLRQIYGVAENRAHRALDDVKVLHEVFSQMIDDLSIETVLELLNNSPANEGDSMPFGKHQGKPLSEVPPSYIKWLAKQGAFDKPENNSLKEAFKKLGIL